MAGHSKWANIRHRKGAQDAKRSKIFAKLSKEIMVAATRGADPESNAALRLAISKARAQSMPKKNIESAIGKASGGNNAENFNEIVYGGNIAGVSFLVICLTDNANRLAASIQHAFNRANGATAGASSVSYIFDRKGVLEFDKDNKNEDDMMMLSLEIGADDFEVTDDTFIVYTDPSQFTTVKSNLEKNGVAEFKTAEVKYIPNNEIKLPNEKAQKILEFIDNLEDNEDVQDVYHNLDASSLD